LVPVSTESLNRTKGDLDARESVCLAKVTQARLAISRFRAHGWHHCARPPGGTGGIAKTVDACAATAKLVLRREAMPGTPHVVRGWPIKTHNEQFAQGYKPQPNPPGFPGGFSFCGHLARPVDEYRIVSV